MAVNAYDVKAWSNLGYAFSYKDDFDKGLEYFQKATKLDPKDAAAWNGLGYVYNHQQKYFKAVECCRKAISLDKNFANAWNFDTAKERL